MKTRILSILLAIVMVLTMVPLFANGNESKNDDTPKNSEKQFKDLKDDHWASQAIQTMLERNILQGYKDGSFKPEGIVTRAEFAKLMVLTLNLPKGNATYSSFVDMQKNHWAVIFVEAARKYLTGFQTPQGIAFRPEYPAQREDMAVALVRALKLKLVDEGILNDFMDADEISPELRPYVATAIANKLMKGYKEDGKFYFNPMGELTRAETAQLLLNVLVSQKIVLPIDEKIVLPAPNQPLGSRAPAVLSAKGNTNYIELKWRSGVKQSELQYFKVTASLTDKTPQYPDNGYAAYFSSIEDDEMKILVGSGYNGNEFSNFEAGKTYYIAITTVFKDGTSVTSNVVRVGFTNVQPITTVPVTTSPTTTQPTTTVPATTVAPTTQPTTTVPATTVAPTTQPTTTVPATTVAPTTIPTTTVPATTVAPTTVPTTTAPATTVAPTTIPTTTVPVTTAA